jgi:hypothetical protein
MSEESTVRWTAWPILVHSLRTAIACVVSLLVARLFRLPEAYWAPVTTVVITQSSLGAALAVLACPHCWGRLRLIATLHDPVVIRKLLAHLGMARSGPSPGPAPPSLAASRPDLIFEGRPPSCLRREASFLLIRPAHLLIDSGGLRA